MKKTFKKAVMALVITVIMATNAMPVFGAKSVALKSIALNATTASIGVNASTNLTVRYNPTNATVTGKVTWTSSSTAIATVSSTGRVTGKKAGTATITATLAGKKATCKVTVKNVEKSLATTEAYTLLNKYRSNAKIKTLAKDAALEKIAKQRAKELVTNYSHTRPNGQNGLTLIPGNLYKGENIARGQKTCSAVSAAWYASTGHRANMLKTQFKKVGIAGLEYNGVCYWVQIFSS